MLSSRLSLIIATAAAALVEAQSSVTLFAPTFDVVAYVLGSSADVTSYLVACTAGAATSACNFVQPYTLTEGPSTVQFALTVPGTQTATLGCAIADTTSLACSATGGASVLSGSTITAYNTIVGAAASTHFRAIEIVTDSSSLLTYATPTAAATTTSSVVASSTGVSSAAEITSAPSGNATATKHSGSAVGTGSSWSNETTTEIGGGKTSATSTTTTSGGKTKASGIGNAGSHLEGSVAGVLGLAVLVTFLL